MVVFIIEMVAAPRRLRCGTRLPSSPSSAVHSTMCRCTQPWNNRSAVLRPGRLVKIRVVTGSIRPSPSWTITSPTTCLSGRWRRRAHLVVLVHDIYGTSERRHLCDVRENGSRPVMRSATLTWSPARCQTRHRGTGQPTRARSRRSRNAARLDMPRPTHQYACSDTTAVEANTADPRFRHGRRGPEQWQAQHASTSMDPFTIAASTAEYDSNKGTTRR